VGEPSACGPEVYLGIDKEAVIGESVITHGKELRIIIQACAKDLPRESKRGKLNKPSVYGTKSERGSRRSTGQRKFPAYDNVAAWGKNHNSARKGGGTKKKQIEGEAER